ncbi:hypothetical protein [Nostoc sp. LEGE 12450]|uniref:hypothetical protein n=1 Tax=Nostoc sp. LEGE 12450 TaxID=1828643 RepID=UPI001882ED57|nr:hypothetical protein [Nostoc sp. LEGE 12450]MBE8989554.1 hypothetical protein [Nostoc sp. LEGE 12450]
MFNSILFTGYFNRTYAKLHTVGAIHELPLHKNQGFDYCFLTFGLLLLMLPGLLIDERIITGAPAWLKPCKFAFSTSVYSFTFVWLLGLLKQHRRLASLAANATAFALVVQIIVIIVQVVRGTTSHFNFSTPEDEALWKFMEIALVFLWAATLVTVILLLLERLDNPVLAIALRFSLSLTFIGI